MKIGVIYYSYSGHTALVVDQLVAAFIEVGDQVEKVALETLSPLQLHTRTAPLKAIPDVGEYDALILGSPVHGGYMAAPMRSFLDSVRTLEGKPVAFLLTHFLPRKWGAIQVIEVMEGLCWEKGAKILGSADVTWFGLGRKGKISDAIHQLQKMLLRAS